MKQSGFTLIELSIVLVIIGLIVGGVLVGRDLITGAAIRSQIAQLDQFKTATNTFIGKFGALPGDITAGEAARYGFAPRGDYVGEGDGNGNIRGIGTHPPVGNGCAYCNTTGELALFWADLSFAKLIQGSFTTATATVVPGTITGSSIALYMPEAKIGQGNYVFVTNGGDAYLDNMLTISAVYSLPNISTLSNPGLTVNQAYKMDSKIDDGLPQSGNAIAYYVDVVLKWSDPITCWGRQRMSRHLAAAILPATITGASAALCVIPLRRAAVKPIAACRFAFSS